MKIIHAAQQHAVPSGITPDPVTIENVIQSQLIVARVIKEHPTCPIVVEKLFENASNSALSPMSGVARMLFSNGIPEDFNLLTEMQKDFLYENGAPLTLFYLGKIQSLNKSIHKDIAEILDSKSIEEKQSPEVGVLREKQAMKCSKEAAINISGSLDGVTIILVYGAAHNFKPYCDEEGFDHEVIQAHVASQEKTSARHSIIEANHHQMLLAQGQPTKTLQTYTRDEKIRFIHSYGVFSNPQLSANPMKEKAIPVELEAALKDSRMLRQYITDSYTTLERLVELHNSAPWVINALRRSNIKNGIYNNEIKIDQLAKLTEQDTDLLMSNFNAKAVQSTLDNYVEKRRTSNLRRM